MISEYCLQLYKKILYKTCQSFRPVDWKIAILVYKTYKLPTVSKKSLHFLFKQQMFNS